MKKIICLLTVLLMCTVSYGTTTDVTAQETETKVLVIGHGNDFVAVVEALKNCNDVFVVFNDNVAEARQGIETLKELTFKLVPYDFYFNENIILADKVPNYNYREGNKPNLKNISKNFRIHKKPYRSPRDAI